MRHALVMRHAPAIACLSIALAAATAGEAAAQFGIGIGPRGFGYGSGFGYGGFGGYPFGPRYGFGPGFGYGYPFGPRYGFGPGFGYGYGFGDPFYDRSRSRSNNDSRSSRYSYRPNYVRQQPAMQALPAVPVAPPTYAAVTILVPVADAQVRFGDQVMTAHAGETARLFHSPSLAAGKTFEYVLQAEWTSPEGETVRKSRTVDVSAGLAVTVDFSEGPNEATSPPKTPAPVAPLPPTPEPETVPKAEPPVEPKTATPAEAKAVPPAEPAEPKVVPPAKEPKPAPVPEPDSAEAK